MRNLLKRYGTLITGIIIGAMLTTAITAVAASILTADYNENKITYNGQELQLDRPMISIVDDEMEQGAFANYMPVRAVLEAMGYSVVWDSANNTVVVTTSEEQPAKNLALSQTVTIMVMNAPVNVLVLTDADFTVWELSYTVMGEEYFANGTFDEDMNMEVVDATGARFGAMLPSIQDALTDSWE